VNDLERVTCGWTVGPVWKCDGDTCVCILPPDHHGTPAKTLGWHVCSCGDYFAGCGRPADARHPMLEATQ
jgi:hypothetical protein